MANVPERISTPPPGGTTGTVQRPGGGLNPGQRPGWGNPQPPNWQQVAATQGKKPGGGGPAVYANQQTNDAQAFLVNYLGQFGLQSLAGWAWSEYVRLGGGQGAMDTITLELPNQPAFKARFPAIEARQKAGLPQLTPAQYLQYESSLDAELATVGSPIRAGSQAFTDITTKMLAGDVSISEAQARIENGYATVRDADPSVRQWFGDKFGVQGDHALASYFLAPEHALTTLQRMEREAEIGGAGARSGVNVGLGTANELAALNPSGDVSSQFQRIAQLNPVFNENVNETANLDPAVQGIAAEFGLDSTSALKIQRRLDERAAALGGSGRATESQSGVTGYGVAR